MARKWEAPTRVRYGIWSGLKLAFSVSARVWALRDIYAKAAEFFETDVDNISEASY
jgi:hypothetical protein